ncbi:hypothetical protein C6P46_000687 [Rhodotorula mucilaginosa]|uniref:Uncharacterized protein n=1 Tax=Rhodotorula mucilaginosa TaxID=5537 RepID=A0A9P7B321_RHOMI|nr:hypothetical protein C6P46_000687 [Rhodotorula mucilaginosa]TKA51626.1 hypothetical protein B0A53_05503 [Rhodotorula sp. CCFEE 5036]
MTTSSESSDGRSSTASQKRVRTMHSLGMGKTISKHITNKGTSAGDDDEKQPLNDIEAQAAQIRSQRQQPSAPHLSMRRKLYIGGTLLICVVIIVIGSVVGVRLHNSHKTSKDAETSSEAAGQEAAKALANASLLVDAHVIQGSLQRARPTSIDVEDGD